MRFPCHFQGDFGRLLDPQALHVVHGQDRRVALASHLHARARHQPAADTNLDQIGRRRIGNIGGMEPGCAMHPLVHVCLQDVDVAVQMDDADVAIDVGRNAAHIGVADGVVAAQDDGRAPLVKTCSMARLI